MVPVLGTNTNYFGAISYADHPDRLAKWRRPYANLKGDGFVDQNCRAIRIMQKGTEQAPMAPIDAAAAKLECRRIVRQSQPFHARGDGSDGDIPGVNDVGGSYLG